MTVTSEPRPDLADLEEAIRHANESAKRVRDTAFYERAHDHLNRRLTEWEQAR